MAQHQILGSGAVEQPKTVETTVDEGPWLWNPDVAAIWSCLIFTSAFGAAVHAANWKRLGQPRRMWESLAWVVAPPVSYFAVGVLAAIRGHETSYVRFSFAAAFLEGSLFQFSFVMAFLNVVAWYFLSGRKQSKYVVFEMKGRYRRDSWTVPFVLASLLGCATFGLTIRSV
jgi:hypothetical protein